MKIMCELGGFVCKDDSLSIVIAQVTQKLGSWSANGVVHTLLRYPFDGL